MINFSGGIRIKKVYAIFLILASFFVFNSSALMIPVTLENITQTSDAIVIGKVQEIESGWTENHTTIKTMVVVRVDSVLKGNISNNNSIMIATQGGTVEGIQLWVEDEPNFQINQTYGIFLRFVNADCYTVNEKYQGLIAICDDNEPGSFRSDNNCNKKDDLESAITGILNGEENEITKTYNSPDSQNFQINEIESGPFISSVTPSVSPSGTDAIIVITGSGFGQKAYRSSPADVGFYYDNDGSYIITSGRVDNVVTTQIGREIIKTVSFPGLIRK